MASSHGTMFSARDFVKEYRWIMRMLENAYPKNEFLFIPHALHLVPSGYRDVPIQWRGQSIYRKSA